MGGGGANPITSNDTITGLQAKVNQTDPKQNI